MAEDASLPLHQLADRRSAVGRINRRGEVLWRRITPDRHASDLARCAADDKTAISRGSDAVDPAIDTGERLYDLHRVGVDNSQLPIGATGGEQRAITGPIKASGFDR